MAIGLLLIGLKRYANTTRTNHEKLFSILEKRYGVKIYDYYRETEDPTCPFNNSGQIQVFDFLKGMKNINEQVLVKIRSDVYFTNSSIDVLIQEIENVISGESDIVYLGIDFKYHYDSVHRREDARITHNNKVTDFVIIARKNKVANENSVMDLIRIYPQITSGNQTFLFIMSNFAIAKKVSCQMYLVRKDYFYLDNWQIYYDWCMQYKNSEKAQEWVKRNVSLIRSF
jgi:hypothetical protein